MLAYKLLRRLIFKVPHLPHLPPYKTLNLPETIGLEAFECILEFGGQNRCACQNMSPLLVVILFLDPSHFRRCPLVKPSCLLHAMIHASSIPIPVGLTLVIYSWHDADLELESALLRVLTKVHRKGFLRLYDGLVGRDSPSLHEAQYPFKDVSSGCETPLLVDIFSSPEVAPWIRDSHKKNGNLVLIYQ